MAIVKDEFFTTTVCDDVRHTFPCERQKNTYRRLHCKKCKICKNATITPIYTEISLSSTSPSHYVDILRQRQQQELSQMTPTQIRDWMIRNGITQ